MATFTVTTANGEKYRVNADTMELAQSAVSQMSSQQNAPNGYEMVQSGFDNGGRILRNTSTGEQTYVDSNFSTTEPDKIAKILAGQSGGQVATNSQYEDIVAQSPVGAAAATFLQGVPFVGEYADEAMGAAFGPDAMNATRAAQAGMAATQPALSTGLKFGGAIAGTLPMIAGALPSMGANLAGRGLGMRIAGGSALGVGLGGAEGMVAGFGAGNNGDRLQSAINYGRTGAIGGALIGAAAPAVGDLAKKGLNAWQARGINAAAREMDTTAPAARVIGAAAEADAPVAAANMARAGQYATLANMGPNTRNLLDYAANTMGMGATDVRKNIAARVSDASQQFTGLMDKIFGTVRGPNAIQRAIQQGSAPARKEAYDLAYSRPIDYASDNGQSLLNLADRVPAAAIRKAETFAQVRGTTNRQAIASIDEAGNVTFSTPPDVRAWDDIKQALDDMGSAAVRSGNRGEAQMYRGLARDIREGVDSVVPEYAAARALGGNTIRERDAVTLGRDMFTGKVTREDVFEQVTDMEPHELARAREGVRGWIDDIMARTKTALTDPNQDVREMIAPLRVLTNREGQDKLKAILGDDVAADLMPQITEIYDALALRAAVAQNSKTAIRENVAETMDEALGTAAQPRPQSAVSNMVSSVMGSGKAATPELRRDAMANVARALMNESNPRAAMDAAQSIGPTIAAGRAGQQSLGRTIAQGAAGVQQGAQALLQAPAQGPTRKEARRRELMQIGYTDPLAINRVLMMEGFR